MMKEMFDMVHLHKDFDRKLYEKVMSQHPVLVKNCATPESRKLYNMQRNVTKCIHLNKGFLRFEISSHGIMYAKAKIEHNVVAFILRHFHQRYPTFHVAIEDKGNTYVIDTNGVIKRYALDVEETVKVLELKLPCDDLLKDLDFSEELWEPYYDTQYISERRNIKLMKKNMPLKYRMENAVETRMAKRCKDLNEFM